MAHLVTTGLKKSRDSVDREGLHFESDTSTGLGQVPGVEANPRANNRNLVL